MEESYLLMFRLITGLMIQISYGERKPRIVGVRYSRNERTPSDNNSAGGIGE